MLITTRVTEAGERCTQVVSGPNWAGYATRAPSIVRGGRSSSSDPLTVGLATLSEGVEQASDWHAGCADRAVNRSIPSRVCLLAVGLLSLIGCHAEPASVERRTAPVVTQPAPSRTPSRVLSVSCRTTVRQGEGGTWAVEAERRRGCLVRLEGGSAQVLVAEPERVTLKSGVQSETATLPAAVGWEGQTLTPAQLTSEAPLLRGWLPQRAVRVGETWTCAERMACGPVDLDVTYRCRVSAEEGERIRIDMEAQGGHLLREAGLTVRVEGRGTAVLERSTGTWPRELSARFAITASGGVGPDAVSEVVLELRSTPAVRSGS
jgi:hypothetical protein